MSEEKTRKVKMVFIRGAYWFGIILDMLSAIATTIYMLAPNETFINTIMKFPPITEGIYVILITETALMWGWTALLFWADRKPIERRGVLLLTAVPVVGMIIINTIIGMIRGNPSLSYVRVIVVVAFILVLTGYILAQSIAKKEQKDIEVAVAT
ncbi:MAG: hypothetical protein FK733_14260 [Asgard group archaeon]|nr:hypothetical protein [Asgard group archaeon]